jgi:NAD-dependent SIR2 family protein deacetylase
MTSKLLLPRRPWQESCTRPVIWVGAGASMAAGYPSTNALVAAMVDEADDPIHGSKSFFEVADAYVKSMTKGALSDLLQRVLGPPQAPATLHRHLARVAGVGAFHTIITTNYDDLLERTLADAGVPVMLQVLDANESVGVRLHMGRATP